ncbi:terpenoid cyclases/Protein prenyltransferase [Karstenula rhodostoma CBS 690.94]|uniref:Terpenoid cyclases/Protein prenyltransferase n=1 Tax=Karstenula rhodostoma CBS 690.94 TaxID=1392251 RepID=A0A9P4PCD3_9PLEO|nr:terpenoid cyclases/Protein prenyltransferase [Karstenula rhodostoma CBS 690.94]
MAPGLTRDAEESRLNYAAHIRYWRRNLKTFLPRQYTGNDCNRMTLAAFILSALDILGDLPASLSREERAGYIDWVYSCQLPEGGFRPAPATDLGASRSQENQIWDPFHVAGTFFALLILVNLGDGLENVKRREILQWLTKLQRPDGGFGETLGEHDRVEGGNDSRFGFMVAAVRWMLRGNLEGPVDGVPDIDVDAFVRCVQAAETYDGGLSEAPYHEAHGGFTSCAISALYFLDRLPTKKPDGRQRGLRNLPMTLHWLASRQTLTLDEEDADDTYSDETDSAATCHDSHSFMKLRNYPSMRGKLSFESQPPVHAELKWVGMNGRENKIGDTCYAYWHLVGGFGKLPGDHPDPQHSFLGLMVLSMFGEPGLQNVDTALCITERAKNHLESLPWRRELLGLDSTGEAGRYNVPMLHPRTQTSVWSDKRHHVLEAKEGLMAPRTSHLEPQASAMAPPSKKRKIAAIPEISFDPAAREEYLTGFHKRKLARQKLAEGENAKKERAEKLRFRAEVRKQRKEDLEKHVEEVNRLVRQANGDLSEAGEEDEDSANEDGNDIVEPPAPAPAAMDINEEEEFVDEDKYTTVTIESVGISKHGFEKRGGNEEAEEKEKEKRVWTKERPKSSKPKKKKIKFRYETKTERKVERVKQGLKKKKMAAKRMAD